MRKSLFVLMACSFLSTANFIYASTLTPPPIVNDTLCVEDVVLNLLNNNNPVEFPLPHVPSYPATGLIGKSDHNLYLFPLDEAQTVTVTLCNEEGTEVFSESVYLGSEIVELTLPANLAGEYTLYYYVEDRRYKGNIYFD